MDPAELTDPRPSPIAGSWYPGKPEVLRRTIEGFLEEAILPKFTGHVLGLIVPHAGYIYSGLTAAHAFKALQGRQFARVIVISPSHQPYRQPLLTTGHDAYATPLGLVPVDHKALASLNILLQEDGGPELASVRRDQEHSLEIELPFLQTTLPESFGLVPLMMVDQSASLARLLSAALVKLIRSFPQKESTLLVASSDLSHFYSERVANRLDGNLAQAVQKFDLETFYQHKQRGEMEACGLTPMATVLQTSHLLGADQVTVADYRTSAAVTGDKSSVVGYLSAVISTGKAAKHD
jgi:AmmeMemoRadiSam system protein B